MGSLFRVLLLLFIWVQYCFGDLKCIGNPELPTIIEAPTVVSGLSDIGRKGRS